jgi:magnesium-protoporphyrin O-methyltransferase
MPTATYIDRRSEIETYFDRTAAEAWSRLTSDAPLGRIRATVRAGREEMRNTLLSWLPADLTGARVLDAGCGTGALAVDLARRGADVVATDLSPTLIELARERHGETHEMGRIAFLVADMLNPALGRFDHIVAMDSLIHYDAPDAMKALAKLAGHADRSVLFTFAPRTPALAAMHAVGRLFPKSDRAPSIEPISPSKLIGLIGSEPRLASWSVARTRRISRGFYMSQAMELARA